MARIDILNDSLDFRMSFKQILDKLLAVPDGRRSRNQDDHVFTCAGTAYHDMSDTAFHGSFVEYGNMIFHDQILYRSNDLIRLLIADHTFLYFNDLMCSLHIITADDIVAIIIAERNLYLVAVMIRIIHADDSFDFMKSV